MAEPERIMSEVPCKPAAARVYEHGWQSWSPTRLYGATERPARPSSSKRQTLCYRAGAIAPSEAFQGEGLLAVLPGDGTIRLFAAREPERVVPSIRAEVGSDRIFVSADGSVDELTFSHDDLNAALADWADGVAKRLAVPAPKPVPPVWCSWYYYWGKVTESDILANLDAADRLGLDVQVVQVDDGYQAEMGDWLEQSPAFGPLQDLAARIAGAGRRMGLWTAPFLVGAKSRVAQEHPDWLVGDVSAGHHWDQDLFALDVTNPDAAEHLVGVFRTLREWGCDYFKIDFIYAGALEGRRREDASGIDAYREGLRLIRKGAGSDATILGCGAPILASVGLVDAMRTSPDCGPNFEPADGDLSQPSGRAALMTGRARAWTHGRWWVHDPDCLIVRPEVERREEWAQHIEEMRGLVASSDSLDRLDDWGLEVTRRLLKPSSTQPLFTGREGR